MKNDDDEFIPLMEAVKLVMRKKKRFKYLPIIIYILIGMATAVYLYTYALQKENGFIKEVINK